MRETLSRRELLSRGGIIVGAGAAAPLGLMVLPSHAQALSCRRASFQVFLTPEVTLDRQPSVLCLSRSRDAIVAQVTEPDSEAEPRLVEMSVVERRHEMVVVRPERALPANATVRFGLKGRKEGEVIWPESQQSLVWKTGAKHGGAEMAWAKPPTVGAPVQGRWSQHTPIAFELKPSRPSTGLWIRLTAHREGGRARKPVLISCSAQGTFLGSIRCNIHPTLPRGTWELQIEACSAEGATAPAPNRPILEIGKA